ncbi:MAG: redoxin domain-containing protein [Planctomycetota bacterium]|nr:redoxin domain-containing protein [Planctomycetota bacterium]
MRKTLIILTALLLATPIFAYGNPSYVDKTPPDLKFGRFVNAELPYEYLEHFEGEVVLVEFFSTWCGPCRAGMKHMQALQEKFDRPDLHIFAVSDESYDIVKRFLYHHETGAKLTYPIVVDAEADWGIVSIPMAYLIGRNGKVVWEGRPTDEKEMTEAVEKALATPAPVVADVWDSVKERVRYVYNEYYERALASAKALKKKEETISAAVHIEKLVTRFYNRYIKRSQLYQQKGDYYRSLQILEDAERKFRQTPYREHLVNKLGELKDNKENRAIIKQWEGLHKTLSKVRGLSRQEMSKAIAELKKIAKENENKPIGEYASEMADILSKPWNPQEAFED